MREHQPAHNAADSGLVQLQLVGRVGLRPARPSYRPEDVTRQVEGRGRPAPGRAIRTGADHAMKATVLAIGPARKGDDMIAAQGELLIKANKRIQLADRDAACDSMHALAGRLPVS